MSSAAATARPNIPDALRMLESAESRSKNIAHHPKSSRASAPIVVARSQVCRELLMSAVALKSSSALREWSSDLTATVQW